MGKLELGNNWKTSVNELITIFRGSLLAIIPWLEKARIKWKDGEAYDDWDNISETLYENIVCSSLTGTVASDYIIAKYNFNYNDYSLMNFIHVNSKNKSNKMFAFISFQSTINTMDTVRVAELDKDFNVIGYINLKFGDVDFFYVSRINNRVVLVDELEVIL